MICQKDTRFQSKAEQGTWAQKGVKGRDLKWLETRGSAARALGQR